MKYILQNVGNKKHFNKCADLNNKKGAPTGSFTVNAWSRSNRDCVQYDAGFYVTAVKKLGEDCPKLGAVFINDVFQKGVRYRIRVWPKRRLTKREFGG